MDRGPWEALLARTLDGLASPEEEAELVRMAEGHPAARAELVSLLEQDELLGVALDPARSADSYREQVLVRLRGRDGRKYVEGVLREARRRRPSRARRRRGSLRRKPGWLLYAPLPFAAVAAVLVAAVFLGHSPAPERPSRKPAAAPVGEGTEAPGPAPARRSRARVDWTDGPVQCLKAATDRWLAVREDAPVVTGDSVRTGPSRACIRMDSGSTVNLNRDTSLSLLESAGAPRLSLGGGEIYAETVPADRGFCVETPHGRAESLGTRFGVEVGLGGTVVVVAEGEVEASTDAGKARVGANEEVLIARRTRPPGPVREARDVDGRFAWVGGDPVRRKGVLFFADFDDRGWAGWRIPVQNLWRIQKRPDGPGRVLSGGADVRRGRGADRYASALMCSGASSRRAAMESSLWTDYSVEVSVRFVRLVPPPLDGILILARVQNPDSLYWLEYSVDWKGQPFLALFKRARGSETKLGGAPAVSTPAPSRWYRLRFDLRGPRLRAYLDDELMAEAYDGQFASGGVGLTRADTSAGGNVILWDDVRVANLSGR